MKPFKPLTLKKPDSKVSVDLTILDSPTREQEIFPPPTKKRRLIHDVVPESRISANIRTFESALSTPRKPLVSIKNPTAISGQSKSTSNSFEGYFLVLWYVAALVSNLETD